MDEKLLDELMAPVKARLKPIDTFGSKVPYNKFSQPFNAYANQVVKQQKPWFEYFTAEPQKKQLRNELAAGGGGNTGFAKNTIQRSLKEMYQPLNTSIYGQGGLMESLKSNVINPLYRQRIGSYYTSPIQGYNF